MAAPNAKSPRYDRYVCMHMYYICIHHVLNMYVYMYGINFYMFICIYHVLNMHVCMYVSTGVCMSVLVYVWYIFIFVCMYV